MRNDDAGAFAGVEDQSLEEENTNVFKRQISKKKVLWRRWGPK